MRVCPLCQASYDDDVRKCPYDGRRPLSDAVIAAAAGDPMLGATIASRYVVTGRLGAGGMGTVYRAEQQGMEREVALKLLRRDLGRDPETVARFEREARTLSQLKHPNTVTIFDFGQTEDELLYLVMELLEGEMLSARLKRVGALEVTDAIKVAAGVLRSLNEAHDRGIIHRDLKPDNIFLARVHGRPHEDELVKVVDFGIAKIRDGERTIDALQTQEGTVFGTPRYMSPEQAQGKPLDGRSDLYAVGVLLFHMLTGRPPFTDDDAVVVMAHHIKTVPPPVREVAPARPIPAPLEALVQRALEKDPLNRPQNAEVFLVALERTLAEAKNLTDAALVSRPSMLPTRPPPAPAEQSDAPTPTTATTKRRRATVAAAAAGALLLAVVLGSTAFSRGVRPAGPAPEAGAPRPHPVVANVDPLANGAAERAGAGAQRPAAQQGPQAEQPAAQGPEQAAAGEPPNAGANAGASVDGADGGVAANAAQPQPRGARVRRGGRGGHGHNTARRNGNGGQPYGRWTD